MQGYKIVLLMRFTMLPFSVMSYLLGMTAVRFRDYLIGSLGVAFHVAMFIYAGSSLTYLEDDSSS